MRFKIDRLHEKLRCGEKIYGTQTFWGGSIVADIYGQVGYDAIWIDTEHGAIDKSQLLNTVIASDASGMCSFIRIPWNDMVLAKPILDMRVDGIIFPMIMTAEDAERAVAACRYPPAGVRGFGPVRPLRYGALDAGKYVGEYSKKVWVIIQIEHITAAQNLEAILAVPGIDAVVVGPCDLSGSMGLLPQTDHPEVVEVMDRVAAKVKAAGIPLGVACGSDTATLDAWMRRGADLLFCDHEGAYLHDGSRATLRRLTDAAKRAK